MPLLWLAGPITGLIVQPLVGYYSDRTWTRFGRRRPYFLIGAALAAGMLIAMPNATTLWMAVLMFWMLDASLNLTMGPFRAFVADQMSAEQRSTGYIMYMFFASVGAVVGSLLPWAFAQLGASTSAPAGEISDAVKYAFYVGATLLIVGGVLVGAQHARISAARCSTSSTDPRPREPSTVLRRGCAVMPPSGSGWDALGFLAAQYRRRCPTRSTC